MNLARLGEESVERFGEHPALAFEGRVWVAVLLPNCPEDARRLSAHKWLDATEVAG
jgi:hypothetical protein